MGPPATVKDPSILRQPTTAFRARLSALAILPIAGLLLDLQSVDHRRQLAQDLVRFLVELELGCDQIGEVAERLGGVEDLGFWGLSVSAAVVRENEEVGGGRLRNRDKGRGRERTFFITPTASSVTPTNSSSFLSTSARTSSLMGRSSTSPLIPTWVPFRPFAFVASSPSRARVANIRFVFNVVLHPARNRCWIWASCAKRASPTFSEARAYFSNAVARGSSPEDEEGWVWLRSWEPEREARAMAWGKVLGWGLADGGAVSAAWASAGEEAWDRSWTLSVMVRERSVKDSRMLGG